MVLLGRDLNSTLNKGFSPDQFRCRSQSVVGLERVMNEGLV